GRRQRQPTLGFLQRRVLRAAGSDVLLYAEPVGPAIHLHLGDARASDELGAVGATVAPLAAPLADALEHGGDLAQQPSAILGRAGVLVAETATNEPAGTVAIQPVLRRVGIDDDTVARRQTDALVHAFQQPAAEGG